MNKEQLIQTLQEALDKLETTSQTVMTAMAARKIVEAEEALKLAIKMLNLK
jgi:hypothetical protein